MLHFDGHTLSTKKVTFVMKRGEYFEKANIYGVNLDSGICISIEYPCKRIYDPPTKFYTSNLNFCAKQGGGRKRLPKFKFSAKFPIGLHRFDFTNTDKKIRK